MNKYTTDKIAIIGLVAALLLSIIVGIFTGNGVELQMNIASAISGYIGRVIQEDNRKDDSNERH